MEQGPFATYVQTTRLAIPSLRELDLEPTAEDLELVSELAYASDDLADALAAAILDDPSIARLLERGLAEGVAALAKPPRVLAEYLDYYENIPAWADYARLAERSIGPEAARMEASRLPLTRLPGARLVLDAVALGSGFYIGANYPAVGQSLVATGTVTGSNRRIVQTARWAEDSFETPGSLSRFGIGIQSSAKVRLAHAFARRHIEASGAWDEAYYGKPISSFDNMVFLSGLLLLPDVVVASGAPVDPRWIELRRLQTRTVQYLLGAPRRLVEMPSDRMVRFFVMVVGHLEESPQTARAVVESIREADYFRPTTTLRERAAREATLLIANMFVRKTWGHPMATRIGLPRFWLGVPLRLLSYGFFDTGPWLLKQLARARRVLGAGAPRFALPARELPAGPRAGYEGTAGVFANERVADGTGKQPGES